MVASTGQLTGKELWVRCPFCGDSQLHLNKAHFSVNVDNGLYHCLRCKTSGKLSTARLLDLLSRAHLLEEVQGIGYFGDEDEVSELPELLPGAATHRKSLLERFHYYLPNDDQAWDAFVHRRSNNEACGILLRKPKRSHFMGAQGYAWVGDELPISLPDDPIRFVEGPYDVTTPRDICVSGLLSVGKILKDWAGHYILLCPDGDIWLKPHLLSKLIRELASYYQKGKSYATLTGVEFIPNGLDPDQVPAEDRKVLGPRELKQLIAKKARIHDFYY